MKFAIIENGVVINTIAGSQEFADSLPEETVDISNEKPRPGKGWTYIDGVFAEPMPIQEDVVYAHVSITGSDGESPPGITNNGKQIAYMSIVLSADAEDLNTPLNINTVLRITLKDVHNNTYDIIKVPINNGIANIDYTSTMQPAHIFLRDGDIWAPDIIVSYRVVGNLELVIYRTFA